MNKGLQSIYYVSLICFSITTCATTIKTLPEYDEFVLKNKLMQDIYSLLEGKKESDKEILLQWIYSDAQPTYLYSLSPEDKSHITEINEHIHTLSYKNPREAQEMQQLTSTCLTSLPKRGIQYTWSTIVYCFQLANRKIAHGKGYAH